MIYLYTLFDYSKKPAKAVLTTLLYNGVHFISLNNSRLLDVEKNKRKIRHIIKNHNVILNDFKSHIKFFDLPIDHDYDVYDSNIGKVDASQYTELKKLSVKLLLYTKKNAELDNWRKALADSQLVYCFMENNGILHGHKVVYPVYDFVFTGRSKTTGFNIQGYSKDDIYHTNSENNYLIHFDWISADLRVASIISEDKKLSNSFNNSDPYTAMANDLNEDVDEDDKVTRADCKLNLLKNIYSLNYDGPTIVYYSTFRKWMKKTIDYIEYNDSTKSILGRKFRLSDNRGLKSVFNSTFQGSVAHAMQISLYRIYLTLKEHLLTETHDAVIMASNRNLMPNIINGVSKIMLNPFHGILDSNPTFPVRVSIGTKWKKWELYKTYR